MMKKNTSLAIAVFVVLSVGLFGITGASAQGASDNPEAVEQGRAVFETNCAGCHGIEGLGTDRGPVIAGLGDRETDRNLQIEVVTNGRGAMPAFGEKLSAEEIDATVSHVRLSFKILRGAAPSEEPALATTGTNSPKLVVVGAFLVAAGALFVGQSRKRNGY